MAASFSTIFDLSPSSLHQLIAICPIKLKPSNYLVWRTQLLQIMQALKIDKIIKDDPPLQKIENEKEKYIPNSKFAEWQDRDVLVRSWMYGTIQKSQFSLL